MTARWCARSASISRKLRLLCSASAPRSPARRHRHGADLGLRPHVGVDVVIPAFLIIVLGGVGSFWGAVAAAILVGLAVGITGAYASAWSLMSMYLLLIAWSAFRSRGLFGRKSVLEN
jgi:hypothetical protein